jgi:hypothetical protein
MKLFSFFAKLFGPKPQASVPVADDVIPVVEEQPVVIVPEERPKPAKKKVVKRERKSPSL